MPNRFTTGLFVQPAMGVHPCSHTCSAAVDDCSEQEGCMEGGRPLCGCTISQQPVGIHQAHYAGIAH